MTLAGRMCGPGDAVRHQEGRDQKLAEDIREVVIIDLENEEETVSDVASDESSDAASDEESMSMFRMKLAQLLVQKEELDDCV